MKVVDILDLIKYFYITIIKKSLFILMFPLILNFLYLYLKKICYQLYIR